MKYREKVIEATSLVLLGPSLVKKAQLEDFQFSPFKSWSDSKYAEVLQGSELRHGTFVMTENLREYALDLSSFLQKMEV